jgi:hypothetical protein
MHTYNLRAKLHGEQTLAAETLKLIPIIERHLKAVSGMRIHIQSGDSAKFAKAKEAFYSECAKVSKARIYLDGSHYSMWCKIDINERAPDAKANDYSVSYYNRALWVGEIDRDKGEFTYKFDPSGLVDDCNAILQTTESGLHIIRGQIADLKKQIDSIESSVSYALKPILEV